MNRTLATLSAIAALAAAAAAQCGNLAPAANYLGNGDDNLFGHTALAAPFTFAGSAGTTTWTHFQACTNGWLVLTDGVTSSGIPSSSSYGSAAPNATDSLYGPAGSNPRIMPFFGDLDSSGTNGVSYETSGSQTRIVWSNVVEYGNTVLKSFAVVIDSATGVITFSYSSGANVQTIPSWSPTKYVGLSPSNGTPVTAVDLSPGPTSSTSGLHEGFGLLALDLGGKTLTFTPSGAGWQEAVTCSVQAASHTTYGSGCYNISDSAYSFFATAAVAGPALTGTVLSFTPAGPTYLMTNGGAAFIPPSGGAVNVFASAVDDSEMVVTPSIAFPTPQGPQATVRIHSNGLVSWGLAAQTFPGTSSYTPTTAGFLGAANPGIWFWHDYDEAEAGSGRIVREEVVTGSGTVLCVTWNNVESYSTPTALNPSTVQLQLNLTTGAAALVFVSVDSNPTSSFGSAHLVGYSPGGASVDAGSLNFATALPLLVPTANMAAMTLAATPAPISTPSTGTLVTYTQSNIPEAVPTSGVYFGITILSLGQNLPGTDLGFLGMPGCNLHVASLDATIAFVGGTNSQTTQFQIPAGVPYGIQLFAQSAAIIAANSLPNGQNAFGATLSNGVASFISTF